MDALLERDGMVMQLAAEVADGALERATSGSTTERTATRGATVPARLAPQTAAPVLVPPKSPAEGEEPLVRATRAVAANMMLGPRMMMAMASMTPCPFAWNPPAWYAALSWPATARAAAIAFAMTHPMVASTVLSSLARSSPAGRDGSEA